MRQLFFQQNDVFYVSILGCAVGQLHCPGRFIASTPRLCVYCDSKVFTMNFSISSVNVM